MDYYFIPEKISKIKRGDYVCYMKNWMSFCDIEFGYVTSITSLGYFVNYNRQTTSKLTFPIDLYLIEYNGEIPAIINFQPSISKLRNIHIFCRRCGRIRTYDVLFGQVECRYCKDFFIL